MNGLGGDFNRPNVGEAVLLVYRECLCGSWCATGEGDAAPICGRCGRRMVLGIPETDDWEEMRKVRQENILGFSATLMKEQDAIYAHPTAHDQGFKREAASQREPVFPHYDPNHLVSYLEARGLPTVRQWDDYDGEGNGGPEWERSAEV